VCKKILGTYDGWHKLVADLPKVKRDKMFFNVSSSEMDWVELALSNPPGREIRQSLLSGIPRGEGRAT
jgi:hypothetical protein